MRTLWIMLAALAASCGHRPLAPSDTHIKAADVPAEAAIPPPVQVSPVLPKPRPTLPAETYTVVVNNVKVQELLFALARDAKLQIDIDPGLTGTVTLNAIDQTLPQLLTRISRQIDMRYEMQGNTLFVMRDTPYLKTYRVDYVNLARDVRTVGGVAMQVSGATAGGTPTAANNSTATVSSQSANKFWDRLVENIRDILRETDKVLPAGAAPPSSTSAPPSAAGAPAAAPGAAPAAGAAAPPVVASAASATYLEAGSVIANPETGVLNIRATARQHERIQEFIDQVMANSRRQVLIEATVVEVALSDQYQRGIDWLRVRTGAQAAGVPAIGQGGRGPVGFPAFTTGGRGLEASQISNATPAGFNDNQFIFGGAITSLNLNFALKLLESFGDVRVLSSPKLSVLNNQVAVLKVVDNVVYFTVQQQTSQAANAGAITTVTTTVSTVPVGLVLTVLPQISEYDSISLNVRPSISRLLRFVADPNPLLTLVGNFIPEIQTREMESVLRLESGQVAVLGGLMEERRSSSEDAIPGARNVPGLGQIFSQRADENRKTELVIFLRATVIKDPSIDGDFRSLRSVLPGTDFFSKPQPAKRETPVGPNEESAR